MRWVRTGHRSRKLKAPCKRRVNTGCACCWSARKQSCKRNWIGTPVPPTEAGLPPANSCVAKQSVRLRLLNLVRHHHNLVRIDVYVNGRHRVKETVRFVHVKVHGHRRLVKKGRWHNVTLRNLPQTGSVVIKVVGTTSRHYHLISKQTYKAC